MLVLRKNFIQKEIQESSRPGFIEIHNIEFMSTDGNSEEKLYGALLSASFRVRAEIPDENDDSTSKFKYLIPKEPLF